jgi:hypothetical protein
MSFIEAILSIALGAVVAYLIYRSVWKKAGHCGCDPDCSCEKKETEQK